MTEISPLTGLRRRADNLQPASVAWAAEPGPRTRVNEGLIGIGGRLATPPLPHHRAYGSRTTAVRPS